MIAITYHSPLARHWRGLLIDMNDDDLGRCESDQALRMLDNGRLGDGRLIFDDSARSAFDRKSLHGINRNVRFVQGPIDHIHGAHEVGGARIQAQ